MSHAGWINYTYFSKTIKSKGLTKTRPPVLMGLDTKRWTRTNSDYFGGIVTVGEHTP